MQQFQSQFLKILQERDFISQITHPAELDELMSGQKIAAYIGFDCTAQSLHIGSLIQIMILQILQQCGHQPIVLLGGGTTKVGDPSGKDEARQFLGEAQIAHNLKGIEATLKKFDLSHKNHSLPAFKFVNNDDWLKNLKYIDFLRDIGKHFSVNKMLSFDSVKLRLDRHQPLSFIEFNYMILQAYDFYELNRHHDCILQIGGSDQWGNIVNGVELIRKLFYENEFFKAKAAEGAARAAANAVNGDIKRLFEGVNDANFYSGLSKNHEEKHKNLRTSFGLTTPLLTTSDGKKMGKTADGAVWLDESMLKPFDYFQYFRNVDDADVARFIKLFTHFNLAEIAEIEKKEINQQKEILAFEATKICHGEKAAEAAKQQAQEIFSNGGDVNSLPEKTVKFDVEAIQNGKKLIDILRETGLCESNGDAKRLIKGGGVKVDDVKVTDENMIIKFDAVQLSGQPFFKVALGKKKFFKITAVADGTLYQLPLA